MHPRLLRSRLLWLLALAPAQLGAQALPRTRPELVGMSSARLARLARVLQADVDSGHIAGAVAMGGWRLLCTEGDTPHRLPG
jgi:hypothetical protein